jgi:hypothetical protein
MFEGPTFPKLKVINNNNYDDDEDEDEDHDTETIQPFQDF